VNGQRAVVVRRGQPPAYRTPFGDAIAFVVGEADTHDGFSLHERVAPPGARSTPHAHSQFVESFYVLDGALSITVEGETFTAGAGTYVLVPRGATHHWKNERDTDARVLVIFAPSQQRAYFEELHALMDAAAGHPAPEDVAALAKKYRQD
jgi:quercetin dioxygenase-like cupin family protein